MLAFALLNAGAAGVALLLAIAAGAHRRTSLLVVTALAAYLLTIHTCVLLAGVTGLLTPAGLAVVLAALAVVAAGLARRRRAGPGPHRDARPPATAASVALLVAAAVAGGRWAWPHLVEATRLWVWDDYTYHMVYPALWLRERVIAAPVPEQTFTMQAWYPLAASVVATWFMTPFAGSRGDALAWVSLTGPLYGGLVAAGAAEMLARLGARPGVWALPVVLFATSPRTAIMAGGFSDADLAQAATLFAALAVAVPGGPDGPARSLAADTWLAALVTGLALGVKPSAAPIALVILLVLAHRARAGGWRPAARVVLVFALAWCAVAGYWYARNVAHTGNPLYPAAFAGSAGTTFPETTLLEYARRWGARRAVVDALAVYADWPALHAGLAAGGLLGVPAWLLARRRALSPPARAFGTAVVAATALVLALLPGTPYSAGNAMTFRSGFVHWDSMRYVAILPLLGWTALAWLLDDLARGRRPRARADLAAGVTPAARVALVGVVVVAAGALVVAGHGRKAAATAAAVHREPLFGAAAAVLDAQPPGTRVAVFGDQWIYPAFGPRHDLVPIRVDRDGRPAAAPVGDAMEPGDLSVDPATLRANLRAAGIDVVVLVRQPHPGRPPARPAQHDALEAAGGARLLHLDRAVAIWALDRRPAPAARLRHNPRREDRQAMDLGLFFLMQRDEAWSEQAVYDSALEQMLQAEPLGYQSVWIAEHHFNDYGLCPSPPVLAAFVAARTRALRLGMGVSLLPLHHPVDLAESLAVLDVVSGGRLDVGLGRGGTLQDYQTFQSDRADARARVEEGVALIQRAWSGEPFDFPGRFHTAERLHVRPRPVQRPHPPLFIAANSEDSVLSAARLGLPTLSSFFVDVAELRRRRDLYREVAAAAGRSPAGIDALQRQEWGMRVVHVAPTRAEALRAVEAPFMGYQRKMAVLRSDSTGGTVPDSFDRRTLRLRPFAEYLSTGWMLLGTPDEVREGLRQYVEATGYQRVLLLMALPGLDTALALRSMRLFAEHVAPTLALAAHVA